VAEQAEPEQHEVAYVMGGYKAGGETLSSMERYDTSLEQWGAVAAMNTGRCYHGACVLEGELYVTGSHDSEENRLLSVEKYSPSSDT
jgi:kelch-like protein 12